uniref:Uncharacterized protein n=1 Tax=Marinobacter nauticus TaxID=2743 RepID=A0A455W922_MARNT|nr:hypothetical protein YBY_09830 [Marinobacter nauticus]
MCRNFAVCHRPVTVTVQELTEIVARIMQAALTGGCKTDAYMSGQRKPAPRDF